MTIKPQVYTANEVFEIPYPFVRLETAGIEGAPPWKPGVEVVQTGLDRQSLFADGMGAQILTVVSIHKPANFQERVFYTRKWRDPAGNEFGNSALRVTGRTRFTALRGGYRYEFEMRVPEEVTSGK